MPEKTLRELIIEGANAQILDLATNGRVITDKDGEPIIDPETKKPKRRQLSAADINAINRYLRETRPARGGGDGVPEDIVKQLNAMSDGRPLGDLDVEGDDEASR